jgi:dTDP-4-dehydrorhamnose reductase
MDSLQRILITGSNGLLGQKIVKQLLTKGDHQFLATSAGKNRIAALNTSDYQHLYQSLDITNQQQIDEVFNVFKPTVVINTAAMTNVDLCEEKKEECRLINVTAVSYLLQACQSVNAHFIHLSTDFIFDGENGPYKEEDKPNPLSFYGQSKWDAEQLLMMSEYTNWAIARTIIVYGIAENMSRSNIVLWAKEALEKGNPINVVDDQFRSPTWADDLAIGCLLIADKKAKGVFHLSGKDTMSILELVERVADFFQLNKSVIQSIKSSSLNQAAKRPPRTGFILDKAIRELNYQPISFEEGLKKISMELK